MKIQKASPEFLMVFLIGTVLSFILFIMVHSLCEDPAMAFVLIPCSIGTLFIVLALVFMYKPKENDESREDRIKRIQAIMPQIFGFLAIGMGLYFLHNIYIMDAPVEARTGKYIFFIFAIVSTLSMYVASPRLVKNVDLLFVKDYRLKNIFMKISTLSVLWVIVIMIMNMWKP